MECPAPEVITDVFWTSRLGCTFVRGENAGTPLEPRDRSGVRTARLGDARLRSGRRGAGDLLMAEMRRGY